jgi:MBG domain (YGX type)
VDVNNTTHTNAGTYSGDFWSFTGAANYNDIAATTITDKIAKADATVAVTPYDVTYNGQSHTATVISIIGVNGETGVTVGTVDVTNTTHKDAGTYSSDSWSFTGGTNYNDIPATTITDKIAKANATVVVSGYNGVYDAIAHGASGSVTGVDAGAAALGATLTLGATFIDVPGGTAHWTFSGGNNYNDQSGDVAIVISKAPSFTTVTVANAIYNASPQGGTASVTGVGGLNSSLPVKYIGRNLTVYGPTNTAPTNAGDYTMQARYPGDNNHLDSRDSKDYSIAKAALTITAVDKSIQYSDPVTFTVTYAGFVGNPQETPAVLGGTLAFSPTAATAQFFAPGPYTITPSGLASNNYAITFKSSTLTVTQEDARAYYTGLMYTTISSPTSSTATVTLSATIKDITAVPSDPAYDTYLGDIRNAKVTFINRDTNAVIALNVPVGLVTSADTKTGTATYNWNVNIGTGDSAQYTIGIIVNGYYTRNASDEDTIVTVSKPIPGSINGGGYLVMQTSAGLYPGGVGTKNNFGFNVKNDSKSSPKGNINTIVRNGGRVYQIRGNAMTSLTTKPANPPTIPYGTATFNGKANIQDIPNPILPISIDGNATLQVTMTDQGEPGSTDSIAITVWNKSGGVWFSSNWNGTKTIEQTLGGGNLQVR